MQIKLTRAQAQIVINALAAVSPIGGGSDTFFLQTEMQAHFGIYDEPKSVAHYQMRAAAELPADILHNIASNRE